MFLDISRNKMLYIHEIFRDILFSLIFVFTYGPLIPIISVSVFGTDSLLLFPIICLLMISIAIPIFSVYKKFLYKGGNFEQNHNYY